MRKPVGQKDDFGCAAACLAFFLDKSYEKIVEKLGQDKAKNKGFFCREIVNFLKSQGIKAS